MKPADLEQHILGMKQHLAENETAMADPELYANPAALKKITAETNRLKIILELYRNWTDNLNSQAENQEMLRTENDPELRQLIQADLDELRKNEPAAERELLSAMIPPVPSDTRNTIVEIRPAVGGEESALFAAELFRAYQKFAERHLWKHEILSLSESELGGVKEAVFSLQGDDVFSFMKYESGVHRVQRVPETEASGRIHTSTITVAVLPEADELDEIEIRHEDLEITTCRASGAGGQYVNRTDSAVRMVHKPSGIVVASQQERSQLRNREICLRILKAKLLEIQIREEAEKQAADKRLQIGTGDRSERIRTYNFPQSRITDHRFSVSAYDLPGLMEGNFDQILDPIREKVREEAIAALSVTLAN